VARTFKEKPVSLLSFIPYDVRHLVFDFLAEERSRTASYVSYTKVIDSNRVLSLSTNLKDKSELKYEFGSVTAEVWCNWTYFHSAAIPSLGVS